MRTTKDCWSGILSPVGSPSPSPCETVGSGAERPMGDGVGRRPAVSGVSALLSSRGATRCWIMARSRRLPAREAVVVVVVVVVDVVGSGGGASCGGSAPTVLAKGTIAMGVGIGDPGSTGPETGPFAG